MASETLPLLPREMWPKIDHLVTEDDAPWIMSTPKSSKSCWPEALYTSWAGPGIIDPFQLANVGIYASNKEPPIVPDLLLSLDIREADDIWAKENRCYLIWEFGKRPELTLEIVSNLVGGELGKRRNSTHGLAWITMSSGILSTSFVRGSCSYLAGVREDMLA